MKFTRTEWEIILHRLEVEDAIVEALTDCESPIINASTIADAVYMLFLNGCTRTIFSDAELIVLRECCNGSTWFAGLNTEAEHGELTPGRMAAYTRAANRLETKLRVVIPRV